MLRSFECDVVDNILKRMLCLKTFLFILGLRTGNVSFWLLILKVEICHKAFDDFMEFLFGARSCLFENYLSRRKE